MLELKIFALVWGAMIATSFWESHVEGKHAWDEGKLGWKIRLKGKVLLTEYHFWLFWVMFPLLLAIPLVVAGFSWRLLGILVSAFCSGMVIEDFFWFVVNPVFTLRHFSPRYVKWYPWIKIGKFEIPVGYIVGVVMAFASWLLFWK